MASSENLASLEPWAFRSTFADAWISDVYSRDTETLTKALQRSLFNTTTTTTTTVNTVNSNSFTNSETPTSDSINPFLNLINSDTLNLINSDTLPPTPSGSNVSGSDPETTVPSKRQRNNSVPGASGKVSKRKSRASKRSQTTFITADPANFRQMVQQVTGVRFGNSQVPLVPVLKPEPQRPGNRLQGTGGCLPTLDTSAFLLDHHQQQVLMGSATTSGPGSADGSGGSLSFPQPVVVDGGGPGVGLDFDTFSSFPTLESWKVM